MCVWRFIGYADATDCGLWSYVHLVIGHQGDDLGTEMINRSRCFAFQHGYLSAGESENVVSSTLDNANC